MRSRAATTACVLLAAGLGLHPGRAVAQEVVMQFDPSDERLHLELPVLDLPSNAHGYVTQPSMEQSKWIAADLYELAHFGIGAGLGADSPWGILAVSAFDAATIMLTVPFTGPWQHEEWHRAIVSLHDIDSVNPFYEKFTVPLFDPVTIEIDRSELEAFKRDHPADYVHGLTAGFEAQYALGRELEKNAFFHGAPRVSGIAASMLYTMATTYAFLCAGDDGAGDCVLWADGLFAPDGPVPAEGAAATEEQRTYLETQALLSLLNFVDPFLAMVRHLDVDGHRLQTAIRYYPTAFGSTARLDLFYRRAATGLLFNLDLHLNDTLAVPGVGLELVPVPLGPATLGGRLALWLQPEEQSFTAEGVAPGADVAARLGMPLHGGRIEPWVELEAKTAGWMLGNPYLGPNLSGRTGLSLALF